MAEEKQEAQATESVQEPKKKGKGKMLIIIILALLIAAGASGYFYLSGKSDKSDSQRAEKAIKEKPAVLIPLEPFVLNLSEQGRYLKLTMQLELSDEALQDVVKNRIPQIRDAVITLVSSKSAESLSSPEGKFQLKDELLLRVNQAMEQDIFKNIYFTEFVMQ